MIITGGEKNPENLDLFDVMGHALRLEHAKYKKENYDQESRNSQHFAYDLWNNF